MYLETNRALIFFFCFPSFMHAYFMHNLGFFAGIFFFLRNSISCLRLVEKENLSIKTLTQGYLFLLNTLSKEGDFVKNGYTMPLPAKIKQILG